jgi:hypothetical protein
VSGVVVPIVEPDQFARPVRFLNAHPWVASAPAKPTRRRRLARDPPRSTRAD